MLLTLFSALSSIVFAIVFAFLGSSFRETELEVRVRSLAGRGAEREAAPFLPEELNPEAEAALSTFDRRLLQTSAGRYVHRLKLQGQTSVSITTTFGATIALAAAGFLALYYWLASPVLGCAAGFALSLTPIAYLLLRSRKRIAAFEEALPECIETCARAIRVGQSIVGAIDIVAGEAPEPARTEFAEVFKKQNYGLPLRDALLQMLDRVPSPDLQVFITGILVQRDTGGNLAEVMDRIVGVIRERTRIQREVRTHTAQGRLTGWILCLLPVGMLAVINITNPGYSAPLLRTEVGRKLLYAGICFLALGTFTIRRIIRSVEV